MPPSRNGRIRIGNLMKLFGKTTSAYLFTVAFLFNITARAAQTATGTAVLFNGFVVGVNVTDGGSGYAWAPAVTIAGGGGAGAGAYATVSGGSVTSVTVTNAGSGYSSAPLVTFAPPSSNLFSSSLIMDLPLDGSAVDVGPYAFTVLTNGSGVFTTNRYLQTNSAFALNGVNQYLSIPYNANLFPDEMTLALWVNLQQTSGTLMQVGSPASDGWRGYALAWFQNALRYTDYTGSGYNASVSASTSPSLGSWHQVVISRSTDTCTMFIDGKSVGSETGLTTYAKPQVTALRIGAAYNFDESPVDYVQGAYDNIHIYNQALTDTQVSDLYTNEVATFLPVLGIRVSAVRVSMTVEQGKTYQLLTSSNLTDWAPYGDQFTATNSTAYEDVNIIDTAAGYFRLALIP